MMNNTKQKSKKVPLCLPNVEGSQFLFVCHFLCGNDFLMLGEFPTWSFLAQANSVMVVMMMMSVLMSVKNDITLMMIMMLQR